MAVCTLFLVPSSLFYLTAKILSHSRPDYRQVAGEEQQAPESDPVEPLLAEQQHARET